MFDMEVGFQRRRDIAVAGIDRQDGFAVAIVVLPATRRPDRPSRPPFWSRTRHVTVDSGQKQATGTWVSRGSVTLMLGTLGGGAG